MAMLAPRSSLSVLPYRGTQWRCPSPADGTASRLSPSSRKREGRRARRARSGGRPGAPRSTASRSGEGVLVQLALVMPGPSAWTLRWCIDSSKSVNCGCPAPRRALRSAPGELVESSLLQGGSAFSNSRKTTWPLSLVKGLGELAAAFELLLDEGAARSVLACWPRFAMFASRLALKLSNCSWSRWRRPATSASKDAAGALSGAASSLCHALGRSTEAALKSPLACSNG
mmetsp:Transcript_45187/g.119405  ORF Transcript_45187/g.119405 Transcript_45187/m.119405 type:complete len:229 (+) Transcript_45187:14-700(+)